MSDEIRQQIAQEDRMQARKDEGTHEIPWEISLTPEGAHCGHGLPDDPDAREQALKAQEAAGAAFKGIADIPGIVDEAKKEILHNQNLITSLTSETKTMLSGILDLWKEERQKQRNHVNIHFEAIEAMLAVGFHPPPSTPEIVQDLRTDRRKKLLADLICLRSKDDRIKARCEAEELILRFMDADASTIAAYYHASKTPE